MKRLLQRANGSHACLLSVPPFLLVLFFVPVLSSSGFGLLLVSEFGVKLWSGVFLSEHSVSHADLSLLYVCLVTALDYLSGTGTSLKPTRPCLAWKLLSTRSYTLQSWRGGPR